MRFLDEATVRALFDMDTAISSQRAAFAVLGHGTGLLAPKSALTSPDSTHAVLGYLARLSEVDPVVCKVVTVRPGAEPSIAATLLVLDEATGEPRVVMEATGLTAVRTAAASAVAVDELTPAHADELAVLGCGVQGAQHIDAISRVRALRKVRLWSRNPSHARELAARLDVETVVADSPAEAVRGAPIVAACTSSERPVVPTAALATNALVITVGSFQPHRSELEPELVAGARIVVDDHDTALHQCGALHGHTDFDTLGEVVVGSASGPTPGRTVYASVGLGLQDAAAAQAVLDRLAATCAR